MRCLIVLTWPFVSAFLFSVKIASCFGITQARSIKRRANLSVHAHGGNVVTEMIPLDKEPPMRILLFVEPTPFNYISGYANRFKEMLRYLDEAGDEVHVMTPDKTKTPPAIFRRFPITSVRGFEFPMYNHITLTFDLSLTVPRLLKRIKPDLIHVSTPSAIIVPVLLWARLLKIPIVMSYHTDLVQYSKSYSIGPGSVGLAKWLVRNFHKHADLTLCTSPQLRDTLRDLGVQRVDVWQKGINTEVFAPEYKSAEMRARLSEGDSEAPLLLYVGRLGREKKLHRLRKVLDAVPGTRLAVVGTGPAEQELKDWFQGYPVHFAGQLTGETLSAAYASCDVFVMPSDSETLGFVVLEAMASGIPAVAVAAGGIVDLIEDGRTGYLVQNCDGMEEFTARVRSLTDGDTCLRTQLGEAGREWAQRWSWRAATARLRNVQYRKALSLFQARDEAHRHVQDIQQALEAHYDAVDDPPTPSPPPVKSTNSSPVFNAPSSSPSRTPIAAPAYGPSSLSSSVSSSPTSPLSSPDGGMLA